MGLRARKSIKIAPGVKVNLSTKSVGLSFGGKGATYSVNSSGRRTTTVGIPGTGISYTSSKKKYSAAKTKKKQLEQNIAKMDKEQQKRYELEYAQATVEEYETKIEAITSIHRFCAEVIPWEDIINTPAPFEFGTQGPREIEARKKADSYKPGFLAKHIRAFNSNENGSLEKRILEAIEEDKKEYAEWENIHSIAIRINEKDTDAMLDVISSASIFDELTEYGSGFEVGMLSSYAVEVEFDIMADEVVPVESAALTATGKLSKKKLSATNRLDIMQDYVCSCVLRIARDLFAILPVTTVLIHAQDSFIDTSIGNSVKQDILSVLITRDKMEIMDFDLIDPSDAMSNFIHNMKFLKTKGFQPITRINVDNVTDK